MKKKNIIIGLIVVLIIAGVGGGYFFWQKQQSSVISPEASVISPTPVKEELLTWTDPAGFSFQYGKDITIDKHDEDQANYAHVEMSAKDHPGSLIFWAKDLPVGVTDGATWVKKEKQFTGGNVLDTTLGGQPGKKVLISSPKEKVYVGTVYDGLLWYMEVLLDDKEYWNNVADTLLDSFAFTPAEDASDGEAAAGTGSEEEYYDEEEVIE